MPRFSYVNTDFPSTVTCAICTEPFVDPVAVCEEEHPFCKECLLGWMKRKNTKVGKTPLFTFGAASSSATPPFSSSFAGEKEKKDDDATKNATRPCPYAGCECTITLEEAEAANVSKQLARIADTVEVYCTNKARGCKWKDQRNSLERHLADACPCVTVPCTAGCGQSVERREMEKHTSENGPCPKAAEVRRAKEKERLAGKITAMLDEAEDLVVFDVRGDTTKGAYARVTKRPESLLALYVDGHRERFGKDKPVWIDSDVGEFALYLHWVTTGEVRVPTDVEDDIRVRFEFRKWGDLDEIGARVAPRPDVGRCCLRLAGCDLSGLDLSAISLHGECDFDRTVLRGTILPHLGSKASFCGADARGSNLHPQLPLWKMAVTDENTRVDGPLREPDQAMWAKTIADKFDVPGGDQQVQRYAAQWHRQCPTFERFSAHGAHILGTTDAGVRATIEAFVERQGLKRKPGFTFGSASN